MRITHCEYPRLVFNKYLGRKVLANCGHCAVCQSEKQNRWIARIINESKYWKFTRVIQLDYNDEMIPRYELVDNKLCEVQERFYRKVPQPLDAERNTLDLQEFYEFFKDKLEYESNYFFSRLYNHRLGIPHVEIRDLQTFFKRLNTYIRREVTGKYFNFRYFAAAEYGATTFRPHYHLLLFFNEPAIAEQLPRLCVKAWSTSSLVSFGHVKVELDRGHSASYISKYITKSANIPLCYSHARFKTFYTASRRPPFGSLPQSVEEVRQIFYGRSCTRVTATVSQGSSKLKVVPLSETFERRLFPKCPFHSEIPSFIRVKYVDMANESDSLNQFVYKCLLDTYSFDNEFLVELTYNGSREFLADCLKLSHKLYLLSDFANWTNKMTMGFQSLSSLTSFYYYAKHLVYLATIFDESVSEVMKISDEYYDLKELYKLGMFYKSQDLMLKEKLVDDIRCFYPLTYLEHDVKSPVECKSGQNYVFDCVQQKKQNLKSKVKAGYLDSLKESDSELFNFLKLYFYAKKCNEDAQAFTYAWA